MQIFMWLKVKVTQTQPLWHLTKSGGLGDFHSGKTMSYRPANAEQELLSGMELVQILKVFRETGHWEVGHSWEGSRREDFKREAGLQNSSPEKFLDNLGFSLLGSKVFRSSFHGLTKAGD